MKRRGVNVLTIVSLVLAMGLAALWALSYFRAAFWSGYSYRDGGVGRGFVEREWTLGSMRGQIIWQHTSYGSADGAGWAGHWRGIAPPQGIFIVTSSPSGDGDGFAGLYWHNQHVTRGAAKDRLLKIPHWLFIAAFLMLPMRRWHQRRVRSFAPGMCASCGYDLRATPERCPECGAARRPLTT